MEQQLQQREHGCSVISGNGSSSDDSVMKVSAMMIYNLPLFEGYLVIDTRPLSQYHQGHIVTAVPFIPPLQELNDSTVISYLTHLMETSPPERYTPITIYSDDSAESQARQEWLSRRLIRLKSQPLVTQRDHSLWYFQSRAAEAKIYVLEGGYNAFQKEFSFLCSSSSSGDTEKETKLIALPCMIHEGLFLGSRPVNSVERRCNNQLSLERKTLHDMGIEYVILNGNVNLPLTDCDGLNCVLMDVPDDSDVDMIPHWILAIEQMRVILNQNKKILVQLHGRSRSAALVVAWLMKGRAMTFESALQHVRNCCFYKLDEDLMYLHQLRHFETHSQKLIT